MARLAPYAFMQELDNNGYPLVGGKIYTYEAGTTTPKATYTDAGATIANANPVILDGSGRAAIWLGDGAYKLVLKTSADVTIKTIDNITGESANAFGSNVNIITSNTSITAAYANSSLIASNTITLTLPPVDQAGQGFYFTIKNNGSGIVTIDPDAAELIDGVATKAIGAGYLALVICNGSAWYTLFLATVAAASDNTFTGTNTFSGTSTFNGTTNLNGTTNIPDGTVSTYAKIASGVFASSADIIAGTASKLVDAATINAAGLIKMTDPVSVGTGTTKDFTIPSGVKRVTLHLNGVSLNATDNMILQLGGSGGVETSGYTGSASTFSSATAATAGTGSSGMAFANAGQAAATAYSGDVVIEKISTSNTYSIRGQLSTGGVTLYVFAGQKTITGEVQTVRLTSFAASNFDAGTVGFTVEY